MAPGTPPDHADASLRMLSVIFQQLACGVRLELLCLLSEGPRNVSSIAEELQLGVTVVSGHLQQLAEHCLVERKAAGRRRIYGLSDAVRVVHEAVAIRFTFEPVRGVQCVLTFPESAIVRLRKATTELVEPEQSTSKRSPASVSKGLRLADSITEQKPAGDSSRPPLPHRGAP